LTDAVGVQEGGRNMSRKMLYIEICICCIFLFGCTKGADVQQGESSTETLLKYTVKYTEYKEEQWDKFRIYVPYVENVGNQDLEKEGVINNKYGREYGTG
jgi:hypothetical protein